jgi:hypothetical protein
MAKYISWQNKTSVSQDFVAGGLKIRPTCCTTRFGHELPSGSLNIIPGNINSKAHSTYLYIHVVQWQCSFSVSYYTILVHLVNDLLMLSVTRWIYIYCDITTVTLVKTWYFLISPGNSVESSSLESRSRNLLITTVIHVHVPEICLTT